MHFRHLSFEEKKCNVEKFKILILLFLTLKTGQGYANA